MSLLLVFPVCSITTPVFAGEAFSWVEKMDGQVRLSTADGSRYVLPLATSVDGVFLDERKHSVENSAYLAVLQVSPSNPGKPLGFCGAGVETRLHVYEVLGSELRERTNVLISSCLHSISLRSQNTGGEQQDVDFSSLKWDAHGFSIDWFSNKDVLGRSLQSTHYSIEGGAFVTWDVLEKP
ncbi:hypothetical protein ACIP1T_28565 [Pseudomonas japonica]|uniref:hypothetical protein n=1 Tax=Pseudomonas japonica TaxID=256466 RepID=UPI00381D86F8